MPPPFIRYPCHNPGQSLQPSTVQCTTNNQDMMTPTKHDIACKLNTVLCTICQPRQQCAGATAAATRELHGIHHWRLSHTTHWRLSHTTHWRISHTTHWRLSHTTHWWLAAFTHHTLATFTHHTLAAFTHRTHVLLHTSACQHPNNNRRNLAVHYVLPMWPCFMASWLRCNRTPPLCSAYYYRTLPPEPHALKYPPRHDVLHTLSSTIHNPFHNQQHH